MELLEKKCNLALSHISTSSGQAKCKCRMEQRFKYFSLHKLVVFMKNCNIFIAGYKINTLQLWFALKYRNMGVHCKIEDNLTL